MDDEKLIETLTGIQKDLKHNNDTTMEVLRAVKGYNNTPGLSQQFAALCEKVKTNRRLIFLVLVGLIGTAIAAITGG